MRLRLLAALWALTGAACNFHPQKLGLELGGDSTFEATQAEATADNIDSIKLHLSLQTAEQTPAANLQVSFSSSDPNDQFFAPMGPTAATQAPNFYTDAEGHLYANVRSLDAGERLITATVRSRRVRIALPPVQVNFMPKVVGADAVIKLTANSSTAVAGKSFSATVTVLHADGTPFTDYTGNINLKPSDALAELPSQINFTAADGGKKTDLHITYFHSGAASLVATTAQSGPQPATLQFNVVAAQVSHFTVEGPGSPLTAGVPTAFTLSAHDAWENLCTGYRGSVAIGLSDAQSSPVAPLFFAVSSSPGIASVQLTFYTAALQAKVLVQDLADPTLQGSRADLTVVAAQAARLQVGGYKSPGTAGVAQGVTITALDAFGNVAAGFLGTCVLSSNDSTAPAVPPYIFRSSDAGISAPIAYALRHATSQGTVQATAPGTPLTAGTQSDIVVQPAAANAFVVSNYPSPQPAGQPGAVQVRVIDAFNNTVTGYGGTCTLSGNDSQVPSSIAFGFTPALAGQTSVSGVVFKTATATGSLTVQDTALAALRGVQAPITVTATAAVSLSVTGFPIPVVAGTAAQLNVRALDAYNNTATAFRGTVALSTTSDPNAVLPANHVFTAADAGIYPASGLIFKKATTAGIVTATDINVAALSGSQQPLQVVAAAAANLSVTGFPSESVAASTAVITVQAYDAYQNPALSYQGNLVVTSTDTAAILPPAPVPASAGIATTPITLRSSGVQTLYAKDTTDAALQGSLGGLSVNANVAIRLQLKNFATPATAGIAQTFSLTAQDAYNNVATGYRGTVMFSSSDGNATLPFTTVFSSSQAGQLGPSATLYHANTSAYLQASDAASGFTGSQSPIVVLPGSPNALLSTLTASPNQVSSDGNTQIALSLHAVDSYSNDLTGLSVSYTSSAGGQDTFSPAIGFTDASAGFVSYLASTSVGFDSVTARIASTTGPSTGVNFVPLHCNSSTLKRGLIQSVGAGPQSLATGDFDQNGSLDVAVVSPTAHSVSILLSQSGNAFTLRTVSTALPPVLIVAAEMTGDAALDLVVMHATQLSLFANTGDGNFTRTAYPAIPTSGLTGLALGDLDQDGRTDIVLSTGGPNGLYWLRNASNGALNPNVAIAAQLSSWVSVADVTNDGILDLITSNSLSTSLGVVAGLGNGTFATEVTSSSTAMLQQSAVGDLNGDGRLDVVALSQDNNVNVFINNGAPAGTFTQQQAYQINHTLQDIELGDINGDGHPDVVLSENDAQAVAVMLGQGQGTFAAPVATLSGTYPSRLLPVDFNHDGRLEVLSLSGGDSTLAVLDSVCPQSCGSWLSSRVPVLNAAALQVAAGDFNRDGRLDVLVNTGNSLVVSLQQQPGVYSAAISSAVAGLTGPLAVADFNADGKLDVLAAGSTSVSLSLGQGNGTFAAPTLTSSGGMLTDLVAGDVNADGRLDGVGVSAASSSVVVLLGTGINGSAFAAAQSFSVTPAGQPCSVALGDVNRDGRRDIVTALCDANRLMVFLGQSPNTFAAGVALGSSAPNNGVALSDFNHDGQLDVLATNPNSVDILVNNGNMAFTLSPQMLGIHYSRPVLGDFNRDGNADLMVLDPASHFINLLPGNGNTTFLSPQSVASAGATSGFAAADFTGDTKLDLLTYDTANAVALQVNGCSVQCTTNAFAAAVTQPTGANTTDIKIADINSDGWLDLMTLQGLNSTLQVFYGAATPFTSALSFSLAAVAQNLAVADINADGRLDVVITHPNSTFLSVLLGTGSTLQAAVTYSAGSLGCKLLSLGDVNGDGHPDALLPCSNGLQVALNNGTGGFSAPTAYTAGGTLLATATADFNSDAFLDVGAANSSGGIAVFNGSAGGTLTLQSTLAVGSPLTGLTASDVNLDGRADLVYVSGAAQLGVLLNTGTGTPFGASTTYPTGTQPAYVTAVDLNADMQPDLVVPSNGQNSATFYYNQDKGQFSRTATYGTGSNPTAAAAADLNHDGLPDVVVANGTQPTLTILYNACY
jgi:hypothetical protein